MRGKIILEIVISAAIIIALTLVVYGELERVESFWRAQSFWSVALIICWSVVAAGYYHQGWLVQKKQRADDVSVVLPTAVFFVQLILFVKGIYYGDWALIGGAIIVNSGVLFSLYRILKVHRSLKRSEGH